MADGGEFETPIDKMVAELRADDGGATAATEFGTRLHDDLQHGRYDWLES